MLLKIITLETNKTVSHCMSNHFATVTGGKLHKELMFPLTKQRKSSHDLWGESLTYYDIKKKKKNL